MFYRKKYKKLLRETKDERLSWTLTLNQLQAKVALLEDKVRRKNIQILTLEDKITRKDIQIIMLKEEKK